MVVVYRWHGASTPGGHELKNAARLLSSSDPAHIQQTEKLEKQLFAKADGWRDGMLQQELRKRNTYLMFALAANGAWLHYHASAQYHSTYQQGGSGTSCTQAGSRNLTAQGCSAPCQVRAWCLVRHPAC
eukprot:GHRR01023984.1.p2 GENE.GHRR01023984.1~~GHRR01023984.1.p2  ORF type:complete len:129 (+),score=41.46 GHRR01023984.1:164-550(+)